MYNEDTEKQGWIRDSDTYYFKGLCNRCDEVQEIMGRPPHWTLRCGMFVVIAIIGMFFLFACFVRYPSTVGIELHVGPLDDENYVEASIDGSIMKLMVRNGEYVNAGDDLLVIGNNDDVCSIVACDSGTVSFEKHLDVNVKVLGGDILMRVVPKNDESSFRVYGYADESVIGLLKVGQTIESGFVKVGTVETISPHSNVDGLYYIGISMFPDACLNITMTNANVVIGEYSMLQRFVKTSTIGQHI